jgi:outer membrane protein insertion porin family
VSRRFLFYCVAAALMPGLAATAWAQAAPEGTDVPRMLCDQDIGPPQQLPPAGSGPVVYLIAVCFSAQGNASAVDPETYLHHIQLRTSRPSQNEWVPYDLAAEQTARDDFRRLWETNFLDDLSIEATDYVFANGVVGKLITYHLEERERIKIVTFEGSKAADRGKIDEALRERSIELRPDGFKDDRTIARVKGVVRELMAEKGFVESEVTHTVTALPGESKLVNLAFHVSEGPRIAIRDVEFVGNRAFSDELLGRAMKENRSQSLFSSLTGAGYYKADKYEEDAALVADFYRDRGYPYVRVAQPDLRAIDEAADRSTRWIQLRIAVTEGERHRLGAVTFEGNQVVDGAALRALVPLTEGEYYSARVIRDAMSKARELYGAGGYMEFTASPELRRREGTEPIVDVILRITEGPRYFVNRLSFSGNTHTKDHVIRREMLLVESGVFNTEALKASVRRINQLGYFSPVEGSDKDLTVTKAATRADAVDIALTLQEQNRNQLQFGAGVSQYEGVFGNVSFTTTNFRGEGETLTLVGQRGARSSTYQAAFTEPYLFDRPITGGVELFSRKIDYLTGADTVGYSEVRSGVNLTGGHALFPFTRLFVTYGYEVIDTAVSNTFLDSLDQQAAVGVPLFNSLIDDGRHIESRITPSLVHNTTDHPIFPRRGRKLTVSLPLAGGVLGGTSNYIRPEAEAIFYIPHTRRTALGLRANAGWLRPFGGTGDLPYYLRYYLGGETQIRGVDIRTVGPTDGDNRAIGGNRFVLFNAEYYLDIVSSVRAMVFHDAGQAFSEKQQIDLRRLRTSSGVELRVMMPVLNVPFRFIYAWNTYRDTFQPARTFKFAVGTTF